MEIFKNIEDYSDYEISNFGRVKSLKFGKEKILNPTIDGHGYFNIGLFKNGKRKVKTIHQLVAESFLNHIPCGHELVVDHVNDIRTDNRVENLQIITNRLNCSKSKKNGTSVYPGVYYSKKHNKWIAQILFKESRKYLGIFTTELKAHNAYQIALNNYEI
jgi:hypothetical protein